MRCSFDIKDTYCIMGGGHTRPANFLAGFKGYRFPETKERITAIRLVEGWS